MPNEYQKECGQNFMYPHYRSGQITYTATLTTVATLPVVDIIAA